MKILVTGHKGFIGSNVFSHLKTIGHQVSGIDFPDDIVDFKGGDYDVIIHLAAFAALRDSFENPDKFDVTRKNARRHIAFGQGIHVCLGMNLARKEMYTAFPIILDRMKNMRFSEGNNFVYSPNVLLRGLDNLYIEFDQV